MLEPFGPHATCVGKSPACDLFVGSEPFGLVFTDGKRVAAFGVGHGVEQRGVAKRCGVVPGNRDARESVLAEDGFRDRASAFVLNGGGCEPRGGIADVVGPGAVHELVGVGSRAVRGMREVVVADSTLRMVASTSSMDGATCTGRR